MAQLCQERTGNAFNLTLPCTTVCNKESSPQDALIAKNGMAVLCVQVGRLEEAERMLAAAAAAGIQLDGNMYHALMTACLEGSQQLDRGIRVLRYPVYHVPPML
jgi:hypothetical protein